VPVPSPFHARTSALCTSLLYKEWAGYYAVRSYDTCHDREYVAFRHSAGLIDVTALYKYEVTGPDAGAFLSRVMVKDIGKLAVGRVTYLCWCDDDGKVLDDGTVTHLAPGRYRVTAAEPSYAHLVATSRGYDVEVADSSESLAALALQGPTSRAVLVDAGAATAGPLRYFGHTRARIVGVGVDITRTGYTGDLGYEIWVEADRALEVYDALMHAGVAHRIAPAGLDALDVTRIEAGYIMNGVDYHSANHCLIESRKSTPFELGLGWAVQLDRDPFIGQAALREEARRGRAWAIAGLVIDWEELEALFDRLGLPPQTPHGASRIPVPVFDAAGKRQVGYVTSTTWSPTLKKLIALAHVEAELAGPGTDLRVEATAEYVRHTVRCRVAELPFFDPPRKRSTPS
jgi:aminomethyltransferase